MERRKDFYANELNMERMNEVLNFVISNLTLKEILKMVREISYDMVCYYDEYNKGIIYSDDKYSELNQEQACRLQRLLSSACDLFEQSVVGHREFDEGYLNHWLNGGAMELEIARLKDKIEELNQEIEMLADNDFKYFFKYTKEIKELPPIPENFDTTHLQEFIDEFESSDNKTNDKIYPSKEIIFDKNGMERNEV